MKFSPIWLLIPLSFFLTHCTVITSSPPVKPRAIGSISSAQSAVKTITTSSLSSPIISQLPPPAPDIPPLLNNTASLIESPILPALPEQLRKFSTKSAVPGGIISLAIPSQATEPPRLLYQQRPVLILPDRNQWIAILGIPLDAKPGSHTLLNPATQQTYPFKVISKSYPTQRLKVGARHVNPSKADLERIQRETPQIQAALASPWRFTAHSPLPLLQPVQGRVSSPFGLRRYFNGQPRSPHKGLDIAAPQGTPVLSAADGQVVNTGDYFFSGLTIFIDHGQGVVTMYGHLHDIHVQPGESVQRGQPIGSVGKTGRATGPHLHWGVSLNNTLIDPQATL